MPALSLSAVAVGIFSALNVSGLTALTGSRIYDETPRDPTYPHVTYSIDEDEDRGFGTSEFSELTVRVSTFSTSDTGAEGQAIAAKVKELLKDAAITVSGYQQAGLMFWRQTVDLGDTLINGVKVHEWVAEFTLFVRTTP